MSPAPRIQTQQMRNRLMATFAGFTLGLASLFCAYVVLFVYTVEDQVFAGMLHSEAQVQLQHHASYGNWARPRNAFMSVATSAASLPDGIGPRLSEEPARREFPGEHGRHYHLQALDPPAPAPRAWLVAEVGSLLAVRPMRAQMLQLLAWSGAGAVLLALLLGGWLARRTTAPLSRLAALVGDATPEQLPSAFAQGFQADEVGVLARRLEELITRVRSLVEREREFTRDVSHELRTPLSVIRGATERLVAEPNLSEHARTSLAHIAQSAQQLEHTIQALLALAREEATTARGEAARILPVLERVVVEQSPLLDGKDIDVDVALSRSVTTALPPTVLYILLSNLVGNAFAHSLDGRIRVDVDHGWLRISNPGRALGETDFVPFSKGDDSTGLGLGLSIVRRLCERHAIPLRIDTATGEVTVRIGIDGAAST